MTVANSYQFRGLPDADLMAQFRRDALQAAAAMQVAPGGVVGVAPAPAAPVVAAVQAAPDDIWVRD